MSNKILKAVAKKQKPPTTIFNIRVTSEDLDMFKSQADKFTGGNVSAWIKYACRNFVPKKSELVAKN